VGGLVSGQDLPLGALSEVQGSRKKVWASLQVLMCVTRRRDERETY
jgi:hypothetical protein